MEESCKALPRIASCKCAFRGFEEGLAGPGGGWRQTDAKNSQKTFFSRNVSPILLRVHGKNGTEKRPRSLA